MFCAINKLSVPSTSVLVSVPVTLCTELVSVKAPVVVPPITAASLAPVTLTTKLLVPVNVPSLALTVKLSLGFAPAPTALTAVAFATYTYAPLLAFTYSVP